MTKFHEFVEVIHGKKIRKNPAKKIENSYPQNQIFSKKILNIARFAKILMKTFRHPNIADVYDLSFTKGIKFLFKIQHSTCKSKIYFFV